MKTIKVTTKIETVKQREVTFFFVDGIKIAECIKKQEWFCTLKKGTPSTIRDRVKTAYETKWNRDGLNEYFGTFPSIGSPIRKQPIFNDDYADTTWGYPGSRLTVSKVKQCIAAYKQIQKETF